MEYTYLETIYECFDARADSNPNETALVYLGTEWTYGALQRLVQRLAASLWVRKVVSTRYHFPLD